MSEHFPVMVDEVAKALLPRDGGVYVDGTFGAGGYTQAFLEAADCTVIAIDRDPGTLKHVKPLQEKFGKRFVFIRGEFGNALELVRNAGFEYVNGFVLDVGVSSMQLDQAERGFSFRFDGPLDMRMDSKGAGQTAADLVNNLPEEELADLIYQYGGEHYSRRIAKAIVREREIANIETTSDLRKAIHSAVPVLSQDKIDPATKTFQALRIAVNDELNQLERGLCAAESLLSEDGRLIVVSFHSLEDGIVKAFLYDRAGYHSNSSRHLPQSTKDSFSPTFVLPSRKAVQPTSAEIQQNSRSRSAKMRVAVRNQNPVSQEGV